MCVRARSWLNEKGFSLREYNVNTDSSAREAWRRATGGRGVVPVFELRGQVVQGFSPGRILSIAKRQ